MAPSKSAPPKPTTRTRGGGDGKVELNDLGASVIAHFATREDLDQLSQKVDGVIVNVDKLSQKVDTLSQKVDTLSQKVDRLATSFEGYTRREAAISEIRARQSFEKFVSDAGKYCERKDIALLYTPDRKTILTDFDGLYLANTTPGSAGVRNSANAEHDFRSRWAERRPSSPNSRPSKFGTPLRTNAVVQSRGGPIVVIEAKHDIDKSKIDFKLRQMTAMIRDVARRGTPSASPKTSAPSPSQASSTPPASGGAKAKDAKAKNDANLEWFAEHLSPLDDPADAGLVVLFAAENWTPELLRYVKLLNDGAVPSDGADYDALCAGILASHDAAFCDTLNAEASRLLNLRKGGLGERARGAIRAVDVPSTPASVRDFDVAAFKESVPPGSEHETRKFASLVSRMQGFVAPPHDLAAWAGRVGVLRMDGTCTLPDL